MEEIESAQDDVRERQIIYLATPAVYLFKKISFINYFSQFYLQVERELD